MLEQPPYMIAEKWTDGSKQESLTFNEFHNQIMVHPVSRSLSIPVSGSLDRWGKNGMNYLLVLREFISIQHIYHSHTAYLILLILYNIYKIHIDLSKIIST